MKLQIRHANHPLDSKAYDTKRLRENFLQEKIFNNDEVLLTYSHADRIIFGGVQPATKTLKLEAGKELGADYFLQRREMGIINVGQKGTVTLDGVKYELLSGDGLYIGMGVKDISFSSEKSETPAKFYINCVPAHQSYPTVKIERAKAKPNHLGDSKTLNKRTIFQYVHPDVCKSCQLLMGLTVLEPANAWNTMPCHTHERRMEVYFYFDMEPSTRVFHFMGEPDETRHLVVANEQAVISPSWSIHCGVGTANYTFIWGMCGENQIFTDMDFIPTENLK